MAPKPASSMMRALATSQTLGSSRITFPECVARTADAFFVCRSTFSICCVLPIWSAAATLYLLHKFADAHHCTSYGSPSDLLDLVTGGDAQSVEAAIERFQHSFSRDASANTAGGAVLDVNGGTYRDLIALTIGVQRMERRRLHQPDHVGGGINPRQLGMMRRERVLDLDGLLRLTARADRDF